MRICGLYYILNRITLIRYIGSSSDIEKRFASHRSCLRRGVHGNCHLQRAWDKYGEQAFEFSILKVLSEEDKLPEEQRLLDEIFTSKQETYNMVTKAGGGRFGVPMSEETKAKISASKMGKPRRPEDVKKMADSKRGKRHSEVSRIKMSLALKGKIGPNLGKKFSKETRLKMSLCHVGRIRTPEHNAKIGASRKLNKLVREGRYDPMLDTMACMI